MAGAEAGGRPKVGKLGWSAAGALEGGMKGFMPELNGFAGAAPADVDAAVPDGMLNRPPDGGARLA